MRWWTLKGKRVVILGATGTIGRMSVEVLSKLDEFEVVGLAAGKDVKTLLEIKSKFPLAKTSITDVSSEDVDFHGQDGIENLLSSTNPDIVIVGVSGFAGLKYALMSSKYSKRLCLANKESIITGGKFFIDSVKANGCEIIPVDSEHNAIFRLLDSEKSEVSFIYITASGGAVRDIPVENLKDVTPDVVLKHPVWKMGARITIDSSTMFNKGLEVMEAHFLFNLNPKQIRVLIHPQGKIHGMIYLKDKTVKVLMSNADMRIPITYALCYPQSTDIFEEFDPCGTYNLFDPDPKRYPALDLAYKCLEMGDGSRITYNAADEIAVQAFLEGKIGFTQIYEIVEKVIEKGWPKDLKDYDSIEQVDKEGRKVAMEMLSKWS